MKGVKMSRYEEIKYDYSEQGYYLSELIERKQTIESYQRMIERAQQLNITEEQKEKLKSIDLNQTEIQRRTI